MPLFRRRRRHWDPDWGVYPILLDERPAVVTVDLGAVDAAPVAALPVRLVVRLSLRTTDANGLPTPEETARVYAVEDRLTAAVEKRYAGRAVGRYLSAGRAVLCFHLPTEPARQLPPSAWAPYDGEAAVARDADWAYVREVLAPGPVERQWIRNEQLVHVRTDQRDRAEAARPVEHVALLPSEDAAHAAADELTALGYAAAAPRPMQDAWVLEFSREDAVDIETANAFTAEIVRVLEEHDGEYDGWGAPIVR